MRNADDVIEALEGLPGILGAKAPARTAPPSAPPPSSPERRAPQDSAALHDLIISAYVAYPITKGLPR